MNNIAAEQALKTVPVEGKPAKRIYELDALRGLACVMVMLFHYSIRINPADTHVLFHYGYMGVDLFFIISGFVIYFTLEKTSFWADFIMHRFSRLYPAYWVAVSLSFIVLRYMSQAPPGTYPNYLWIFNMTMFQHWIGIKDLDGAYWTLNLELSFYALMLVLYLTGLLRRIYVIVLLLLLPCYAAFLFPHNPVLLLLKEWMPVFRMSYLFAAGLLFYKAYKNDGKYSLTDILLLCVCAGGACFGRDQFKIAELVHVVSFFIIFFLFTRNKLGFIARPILIKLGAISYSLYLIHESIGWTMIKWLNMAGISNWYLTTGITCSAMILLSYLVSVSIEKPAQKWLNSNWKKLKNRYTSDPSAATAN